MSEDRRPHFPFALGLGLFLAMLMWGVIVGLMLWLS